MDWGREAGKYVMSLFNLGQWIRAIVIQMKMETNSDVSTEKNAAADALAQKNRQSQVQAMRGNKGSNDLRGAK